MHSELWDEKTAMLELIDESSGKRKKRAKVLLVYEKGLLMKKERREKAFLFPYPDFFFFIMQIIHVPREKKEVHFIKYTPVCV